MTTEGNNCHSIYIFEEKLTRMQEAGRMFYQREGREKKAVRIDIRINLATSTVK